MSEPERAFPRDVTAQSGMTLRDYFAAQALSGCISTAMQLPASTTGKPEQWIANAAYELADAMLEARKQ